jgi:hypothetical protein
VCETSSIREMESCTHDKYYDEHHLIYREELKKDGEKKVDCSWCHEPIWGSLHNCMECGNAPVHRYNSTNHYLDFTEKLELNDGHYNQVVCYMCHEPVLLGAPAYKCSVSKCSGFVIHKSCAKLSWQINHPLHPHHTLFLRWQRNKRCDACCTSHDHFFFYNCYSCDFNLDIKCANRLPTNPNDCHQHEFSPIWKPRVQFNCEACGEKIKNIAHLCSICKLLVHKRCAEIPRTVRIKLHNHFLNLIYSPHEINNRDYMFCRICGNKVNTEYASYNCKECSYRVHMKCLKRFRYIYEESSPATSESVPNNSIGRSTHLIKALNQTNDEGPHPGEIQHFSHDHQLKLILCDHEVKDDKLCEGCAEFIISAPFYSCVQCQFFFHIRCAELPTTIEQHRLAHYCTLTLLRRAHTMSGVFFCSVCFRQRRGFAYSISHELLWFLDIQCSSIPETLEHEGHQHLFCLALDPQNRKCKACTRDNEKYVFVCTSCDFILGIRCANLPLVAKHKYDTHLLKLTYAIENDSGEYYCLICEEERDKEHWFYYCKECKFPVHPECVLFET